MVKSGKFDLKGRFALGSVVSSLALASCGTPEHLSLEQLLSNANTPTEPGVYLVERSMEFRRLESDSFNWSGSLSLDANKTNLGPGFIADPDDAVYYGECFQFAESRILEAEAHSAMGILVIDTKASPTPTLPDPRPEPRNNVYCSANRSQLTGMRFEESENAKFYAVKTPSELPQMLSVKTSGTIYEMEVWLVRIN